MPGVSIRIVDPDTCRRFVATRVAARSRSQCDERLSGRPNETAMVLRDGWYVTGDIAALDEDGFLEITDRLSRFSKIGGEMVPHIKVEEKLQDLVESSEQVFAVTSGPDEKKGERLLVLHTLTEDRMAMCASRLSEIGLPNLWTPRQDAFFHVERCRVWFRKLDLAGFVNWHRIWHCREVLCRMKRANILLSFNASHQTHFNYFQKHKRSLYEKDRLMSFVVIAAFAIALSAQAPAGAGGGQGGGAGRGQGGGGGRGGGAGRGAPAPAAPAPLQAFADTLAAAINKQDSAAMTKMLAMDALYLDEDGHAIPATVWVMRLTTGTPAKVFTISGSHGQMLDATQAGFLQLRWRKPSRMH
jgi:hypothetical protein